MRHRNVLMDEGVNGQSVTVSNAIRPTKPRDKPAVELRWATGRVQNSFVFFLQYARAS